MSTINRTVMGQDRTSDGDFNDFVITADPLSQDELQELLYSDSFSREERIERLRDLRDTLVTSESADLGSNDAASLRREVDRAIAELEDAAGETMDASAVDHNPEDHSETLSPDSDEYLDRIAAEEASLTSEGDAEGALDEVLDEKEWAEGDGFEPERGVR
jgi:hypothetical protein